MHAPKLRETERSRDMIQEFRGYNHNLRIGDNEFYDMKNMTGSYYPVLSPRGRRTYVNYYGYPENKIVSFLGGEELRYLVDSGNNIILRDLFAERQTINSNYDTKHQLISSAGRVLVVPEWKMYTIYEKNVVDVSDDTFPSSLADNVDFISVDQEGSNLSPQYISTYPSSPDAEGLLRIDTSPLPDNKPIVLESKFSGINEVTNQPIYLWERIERIPALIVRIKGELLKNISFLIEEDSVPINKVFINDRAHDGKSILFNNSANGFNVDAVDVIKDINGNIEAVDLLLKETCFNYFIRKNGDRAADVESWYTPMDGTFSFKLNNYLKWFPNYDYVLEYENRIWVCFCGKRHDGEMVNELRASGLGNFKDWTSSSALADGSCTISLGSDGPFTGAIVYQGHPIFFKENCYHIVYGSYPSNYQVVTENGYGVQAGSDKSLCIIDGVLYYKATDGVYRFDGASHQKISEDLGFERYKDAVGGTVDGKYYIAMTDENGTRSLFVYDTRRGFWHKEDDANVLYFASYNGDLYFVEQTEDGNQRIGTIKGTGDGDAEGDVEWFVETGIMGYSTPDSKYVGKLQVRLMLPIGSHVNFYIEYDSDGYMEFVGGLEGTSLQSFTLPILPRRCDHFKIRIEGVGECKIFSLCKVLEDGGES